MKGSSYHFDRQVAFPIATLVAIALLAIVLFVGYSAARESQDLREQSIRAIRSALESKAAEVGRTAQDYAFWNDAVRFLDHVLDLNWADNNVGRYIHDIFGYDTTYVIGRDGRVLYCARDGERCARGDAGPEPEIERLATRARAIPTDQPGTVTAIIRLRRGFAMVGAAPITPQPTDPIAQAAGPRPVLVYAQHLGGGFLEQLGHDLALSGLEVVPFDAPVAIRVPLAGVDGQPIAALSWPAPRLGAPFVRGILPALVLSIGLLASFTWYVLRQARRAAQAVEDREARFRDVADAASDWIWETDRSGRLIFLSDRFCELTGRPAEAFIGRPLTDLLSESGAPEDLRLLTRSMILGRPFRGLVCEVQDRAGRPRLLRFAGKPALDRREVFRGYRGTATDVSAEVEAERRSRHLALHDALTGLPNRALLCERLEEAIAQLPPNRLVAMLLLDLDRFKSINDTLGHAAGDRLIGLAASRLQDCMGTRGLVARLGGDEFALIQLDITDTLETQALCRRLLAALQEPFDLDGHEVVVTGSIGAAFAPEDTDEAGRLMQLADVALYRTKEEGRNGFRFFEPEMDGRLRSRRALERDLRRAVARGELEVHYQLQLDVRGQAPVGVEALLRWHHPERGWIPPADFIALAEETGLILALGDYVLRTACAQVAGWPGLRLSVNLSPVQFRHGDLVELVRGCLIDSGLAPERLELEITESVLLRDAAAALNVLTRLRGLGVHIAMDDFGAGYSSLSYLQRFAFDTIKIDRSFIGAIETRGDAGAIVRAVVGLGRSLGIRTCAEGVETAEQLAFLEAEGCDQMQGFYFSHAVPAAEIGILLQGLGTAAPAGARASGTAA